MNYPCPQCSTGIAVDDATAGSTVPCPNCGRSVKLPRVATAKLRSSKSSTDGSSGNRSESDEKAALEGLPETPAKVVLPAPASPPPMEELGGKSGVPVARTRIEQPSSGTETALMENLGSESAGSDDDIPVATVAEESGEAKKAVVAKARPAPRKPLAEAVKERRKGVIIPKAVDTLISAPPLKPGDAVSPGNFTLKEPTEKPAKEVKVKPVLMRASQQQASREFRGFKRKIDDSPVERISADEAAPVRLRPRSKIGQLFGRARDFLLHDPKLRKGPAPRRCEGQ